MTTPDTNPVVHVVEVREGLVQVEYRNGLTLSVGTSDSHYSVKLYGATLTVEVAVIHPKRGLLQISEYDTVAQLDIPTFEQLCDRMLTLPVDREEAAGMLVHWADL